MDSFFKRKFAEDEFKKEGRVPPGQALTQKFPVLHYGPCRVLTRLTWDFRVWGEVETPLKLTWQQFSELPRTKLDHGYSLRHPLEQV